MHSDIVFLYQEAFNTLHTLSENFWSLKTLLAKARWLHETSCSEIEDVHLFESMAVSIFVDCVAIEEVCRIGDLVVWDTTVFDCHTGVIKRTVALSSTTFQRHFSIRLKRGNM